MRLRSVYEPFVDQSIPEQLESLVPSDSWVEARPKRAHPETRSLEPNTIWRLKVTSAVGAKNAGASASCATEETRSLKADLSTLELVLIQHC